jgi:hypothetical protein
MVGLIRLVKGKMHTYLCIYINIIQTSIKKMANAMYGAECMYMYMYIHEHMHMQTYIHTLCVKKTANITYGAEFICTYMFVHKTHTYMYTHTNIHTYTSCRYPSRKPQTSHMVLHPRFNSEHLLNLSPSEAYLHVNLYIHAYIHTYIRGFSLEHVLSLSPIESVRDFIWL